MSLFDLTRACAAHTGFARATCEACRALNAGCGPIRVDYYLAKTSCIYCGALATTVRVTSHVAGVAAPPVAALCDSHARAEVDEWTGKPGIYLGPGAALVRAGRRGLSAERRPS